MDANSDTPHVCRLAFSWVVLIYWSVVAVCALVELTHSDAGLNETDWFYMTLAGSLATLAGLILTLRAHGPCPRRPSAPRRCHWHTVQWFLVFAVTLLPTILLGEFSQHYDSLARDAWYTSRWALPINRPAALDWLMVQHWGQCMLLVVLSWLLVGVSFLVVELRGYSGGAATLMYRPVPT